jgi:hypothetical protein
MINLITIDPILMLGKKPDIPIPTLGWIAGGAIRGWFTGNEKLSDIDVFFNNKDSFEKYIGELQKLGYEKIGEHKNAMTFSNGQNLVQCIIVKIYKDVIELLDSFDYTICQFAYDGTMIYSTPLALISTLRKHLGIHQITENPVDSLRRAFKYAKKGFYPCNGSLQKIAHSLRTLTEKQINDSIEISPGGGKTIVRFD